jgi:O-antigen/teichoic acid export membrane protein
LTTAKRLAKNSFASFLTQISTPLTSFLLVFFIARRYGSGFLGEYSVSLSIYYIFQAVSSFGINLLITRDVAQDNAKANKYFFNGSFLAIIFSTAAAIIMCLSVNLVTNIPLVKQSVYILSSSLFFFTLAIVYQSICRAFERLEYVAIPNIAANLLKLAIGIILLFKGYGLIALMIVILGSQIVNSILSLYLALRFITNPLERFDFDFCIKTIHSLPVFTFIIIISTIRINIDVLFLTNLIGVKEAGFYSAAYKLVNVFKLGIGCYIMALRPAIFKTFVSSFPTFKTLCTESIRYLVIIVLPIIAGGIVLADRIIILVYKDDFLPSMYALFILIWILLFYSFNQVIANALIGGNYERKNLKANLIGLAVSIGLNLALIPRFGFIGAAIATSGSVLTVALFQGYFFVKNLFKINIFGLILKPLISAILMSGFLIFYKNGNLVLIILLGAVIYLIGLFALKTFSKSDLEIIRNLFVSNARSNNLQANIKTRIQSR